MSIIPGMDCRDRVMIAFLLLFNFAVGIGQADETEDQVADISAEEISIASPEDKPSSAEKLPEEYDEQEALAKSSDPTALETSPLPNVDRDPMENVFGVHGEYTVSEFTGELRYSYPIKVPPGRNGLTPSVVLQYSSSSRNVRSILGTGWTLDTPKIERYSRTGVEHLYSLNQFTSPFAGGSGELTAESISSDGHGMYLPKVWSDVVRHEFLQDGTWQVVDAQGAVYRFGLSENSRVQSTDGIKVHTWYLSEVRDPNGNTIEYQYIKSQGAVYLRRIVYGDLTAPFEVRFEPYYSQGVSVVDHLPSHARQFPVVEARDLLTRIEVVDTLSSNTLTYSLSYRDLGGIEFEGVRHGSVPFLSEIQLSGSTSTGNSISLEPTTFEYESYDGSRSFEINIPQLNDTYTSYPNFHIPETKYLSGYLVITMAMAGKILSVIQCDINALMEAITTLTMSGSFSRRQMESGVK